MTRISLHELHILSFGCGTGGHILHRLEGKLALHILEREQVLFVRLSDDLVKSRRGLGAEDVTPNNLHCNLSSSSTSSRTARISAAPVRLSSAIVRHVASTASTHWAR